VWSRGGDIWLAIGTVKRIRASSLGTWVFYSVMPRRIRISDRIIAGVRVPVIALRPARDERVRAGEASQRRVVSPPLRFGDAARPSGIVKVQPEGGLVALTGKLATGVGVALS
jgi:hypothetical protein